MLRLSTIAVLYCCVASIAAQDAVPSAAAGQGIEPGSATPEQLEFFELKVRPLLTEHCYPCHSDRAEKLQAGLRLDGRAWALKGGDSGPAVVPGHPDQSLLIAAVTWKSYEMPPSGKLKDAEIATLTRWVEMGAPWPGDAATAVVAAGHNIYDWDKWRTEHWSFRPVQKPAPPAVSREGWIQSDLDRFVLAGLDEAGLSPAPPAEPAVLLRRLYFDLIGLPPTPPQVHSFVAACREDRGRAIAEVVEQLLASPHYGERWGRHWLDVARYSDGHGGFLDNNVYADAWRYRDWVVSAFNDDMPLDRFLALQIAGDLLGNRQGAIATGFLALGPTYRSDGGDPDSTAQAEAETLSDRLDTLGRGMLGLTLACARCHDHKFDPLPQRDYYSLAGVFRNTALQDLPLADPAVVEAFHQHEQMLADVQKRANEFQKQVNTAKRAPTEAESQQLQALLNEVKQLQESAPDKYPVAHVLRDSGSADMSVAIRGNLRKPGEAAPRRFLQVLAGDDPPRFTEGSGRKQLALAVTDPTNPLTARVFVNRVWLHHFGQGLVRTPSNFGALGEPPTHPELLDWLTASFLAGGQSIKQLHRVIVLSATYQMSSQFDAAAFAADGDNRRLWRMNPRRLDVEAWRDALLSVTGELDVTRGGPPTDQVDARRRTLYFTVSRNGDVFATDEFLRRFDFPLMRATVDDRPTSTVPQQFLFLMNSQFMSDRARALVERLKREAEADDERIRRGYELLYQRPATDEEVQLGLSFLSAARDNAAGLSAWEQYAQVLLGANEFMYVR